jgi:catechol 2,3-dioxygenase-like lactoylglutathione lyase family enzyme
VIDHVTIRASDRTATERFYDTVLPVVGVRKDYANEEGAEWGDFGMYAARPDEPPTRHLHLAFVAGSRDLVDRFWSTGTEAGFASDGEPGLRPQYKEDYYGAFLLDPDGNSIEAVHRDQPRRRPGPFDHLWVRVADVAAAARFYELIAPWSGFPLVHEREGFAHFRSADASFSLVADGPPTQNLHMAFGASDNRAVQEFHRAALEAGYRDNGPAGERALYHAGYYAAFVLDADGNNIEVVNHNR